MERIVSDEKQDGRPKLGPAQKQELIRLMEGNLRLARGPAEFGHNGIKRYQTEWRAVANALNAFGPAKKSLRQWMRCWVNLKSKAKGRMARLIKRTDGIAQFTRTNPFWAKVLDNLPIHGERTRQEGDEDFRSIVDRAILRVCEADDDEDDDVDDDEEQASP